MFRKPNETALSLLHSETGPSVVVDTRRVDGKVFQTVGPETAKLRAVNDLVPEQWRPDCTITAGYELQNVSSARWLAVLLLTCRVLYDLDYT